MLARKLEKDLKVISIVVAFYCWMKIDRKFFFFSILVCEEKWKLKKKNIFNLDSDRKFIGLEIKKKKSEKLWRIFRDKKQSLWKWGLTAPVEFPVV